MTSQKAENILNLALDATEEEREKSLILDVGYDPIEREWDLIVKYSGSLDRARELARQVVELQNEYAIVTIKEAAIESLTALPQIEFVEKPKRLFFQMENARRASCITAVQTARFALFGEGVITAILDSGIAYELDDFRNEDGTTRILNLWDQTIEGSPPSGYAIGTEYTKMQIDAALQAPTRGERLELVPSVDISGHGTAVAGIAAGNGRGSGGRYAGVATRSDFIVVKLGTPQREGFPRTTELMQALDYVVKKALEYQKPIAINISFGNTYGSHDGSSLLERFIDDISNLWKSCICVGTGNEAASAGHTSGRLSEDGEAIIELAVQQNQLSFNVQIWKAYSDIMDIAIINPAGVRVGPFQEVLGPQRYVLGGTELLVYYGEASPFSTSQEIFMDFIPREQFVESGVWKIILTPRQIIEGSYELWLPSESVLNRGTAFLFPTKQTTLTIPSTAARVISVGAYDALTFTYADFSGRGYTRSLNLVKPDIVAPGVDVMTINTSGGYTPITGTSFATPIATGSAALMMEWGIVKGNDTYLYGEKVKAYFRRGARPLPGFTEYPNPEVGYGALCVRDSLPI